MNIKLMSATGVFALSLFAINADALETVSYGNFSFTPSLEIGAAGLSHKNQAFGGRSSFYGYLVAKDGQRLEAYAKYGADFTVPMSDAWSLGAGVSAVSALTRGDSDGLGYTPGDPTDTDWESAFVKVSGKSVFGLDAVELSYGRQNFAVGEGFIIAEGHVDQGHEGAYWLGPRKAFDNTALLKLDLGQVHVDAFHLQTRLDVDVADYKEKMELNGLNLQYQTTSGAQLGAMFIKVNDDDYAPRDGMSVQDVRMIGLPVPGLKELKVSAEYVHQKNADIEGRAWYAGATYSFTDLLLAPTLTYRYSEFSRHYDSLLYGYGGDWGTWVQGEIVGEYMLFNLNQKTSTLKLSVQPAASVYAGVILYKIDFDQKPEGIEDSAFATEADIYVDWLPSEHLALGALAGIAKPGEGAKQYFGNDKNSAIFQVYATYKF